ncbi:hypothetical protein N7528_007436 [Penicillium herquei]|nr:hypothetical protein N7528_007436 [Penicillium herquei]
MLYSFRMQYRCPCPFRSAKEWSHRGIWQKEWTYLPGYEWGHEKSTIAQPSSETNTRIAPRSNLFPFANSIKSSSTQKSGVQHDASTVLSSAEHEQNPDASRPFYQFIDHICKERAWLKLIATGEAASEVSPQGINTQAYRNVRNDWIDRNIWNEGWGVLPGMTWNHEVDPMHEHQDPSLDGSAEEVEEESGPVLLSFAKGTLVWGSQAKEYFDAIAQGRKVVFATQAEEQSPQPADFGIEETIFGPVLKAKKPSSTGTSGTKTHSIFAPLPPGNAADLSTIFSPRASQPRPKIFGFTPKEPTTQPVPSQAARTLFGSATAARPIQRGLFETEYSSPSLFPSLAPQESEVQPASSQSQNMSNKNSKGPRSNIFGNIQKGRFPEVSSTPESKQQIAQATPSEAANGLFGSAKTAKPSLGVLFGNVYTKPSLFANLGPQGPKFQPASSEANGPLFSEKPKEPGPSVFATVPAKPSGGLFSSLKLEKQRAQHASPKGDDAIVHPIARKPRVTFSSELQEVPETFPQQEETVSPRFGLFGFSHDAPPATSTEQLEDRTPDSHESRDDESLEPRRSKRKATESPMPETSASEGSMENAQPEGGESNVRRRAAQQGPEPESKRRRNS